MSTITTNAKSPDSRVDQANEGWSASLVMPQNERATLAVPVLQFKLGGHGVKQCRFEERLPKPVDTTAHRLVSMWLMPQLRTVKAQWRNVTPEGKTLATSFLTQSVSCLASLPSGFTTVEIAMQPRQAPELSPGQPGQKHEARPGSSTSPGHHQPGHAGHLAAFAAAQPRHWVV